MNALQCFLGQLPISRRELFTEIVEKSVEKIASDAILAQQFEQNSGLHHVRAPCLGRPATLEKNPRIILSVMRPLAFAAIIIAALTFGGAVATSAQKAGAAAQPPTTHADHAHHHPEAAKLKNPVASTPQSIAAGKALFVKHCSSCHGDTGKGDGMEGEDMDPKPANLTDADWKHGDSDGEIFVVIRDGTKTGMRKFGSKLTTQQMWQLVNYVRSIGPSPTK
jgi:mono/diheme cytochrome c family protein